MKLAVKVICYILVAAIVLPCVYLWTCILTAKLTDQPLQIAGHHITVTDWDISDTVRAGTLLAIGAADEIAPGDVILVQTEEGETAGQVLLAQEDQIWAVFGADTLPLQLSNDKVVGKAALVSETLGGAVLFLTTPVGIAVSVFIPIAILFALQTVLVILRRRDREKQQVPRE